MVYLCLNLSSSHGCSEDEFQTPWCNHIYLLTICLQMQHTDYETVGLSKFLFLAISLR